MHYFLLSPEQHLQADPEARGDEVSDELGPAGPGGVARGVGQEGRGRHGHRQVLQTRRGKNQGGTMMEMINSII